MAVLKREALSGWLEFIDETAEKVYFYLQMEINQLRYFIRRNLVMNKLKTKFNNFFHRMVLNTKRISTPFDEINECLQKFYLSSRKRDGRSVITRQNSNRWEQQMSWKSSFFVLNLSDCFSIY